MAVHAGRRLSAQARLEIVAARLIGVLPRRAKRRIAGQPIRRDGLELDLDVQVLLKLAERDRRPLVARSRITFAEGFILAKANMDWYEEQLLGPDGDRRDPRASPLLAEDLSGTPPALVVTAGFDLLRDEGEAYARRLVESGVRTLLRRHAGYVHGFLHGLALGSGAREAIAEMGGVLRAEL